jgi:hypothetical protein
MPRHLGLTGLTCLYDLCQPYGKIANRWPAALPPVRTNHPRVRPNRAKHAPSFTAFHRLLSLAKSGVVATVALAKLRPWKS